MKETHKTRGSLQRFVKKETAKILEKENTNLKKRKQKESLKKPKKVEKESIKNINPAFLISKITN